MDSDFRSFERKRIGSLICLRRIALGLSLPELACLVGIDPSNLSRIERGKYGVGLDILNRICAALDCVVVFLPNSFRDVKSR